MSNKAQSVSKRTTKREKKWIIIAAVAIAIVVIGAIVYLVNRVPSDTAAKIGNNYMSESRVTEYIEQYRTNYSLTDDDDFADFLSSNNLTVAEFRQRAINELAIQDLVKARAEKLGITVSDEEVDSYYNNIKGDNDDSEGSMWASVLEAAGLTTDMLKDRYRYNLLQEKVCAVDVETRQATDDEVLSYLQDYLSGTTQLHFMHIVFSGDGAQEKANECLTALNEVKSAGTLDAATFSEYAKTYSAESNVSETGGVVGWSGGGLLSTALVSALSADEDGEVGVGSIVGVLQSEDEDGVYEIVYVDDEHTFSDVSDASSLSDVEMPDDLLSVVRNAAVTVAWQNDCSNYLNKLLDSAEVTYYAMPTDVPYNINK